MDSINDKLDDIKDFLDKKELESQNNTFLNVVSNLKKKLLEDKAEIIRSYSELPVIKPTDGREDSYIQLAKILESGFKTPEIDSKGYSMPCPVFNDVTQIINAGSYELASSLKALAVSPLYSKYLDETTILFSETDRKILFFIPYKNTPLAIKDSGISAYKVKDDYKDKFNIEFVYLMMRNQRFTEQFPEGMNSLSLLKGYIPNNNITIQQESISSARKNSCKNLKLALDLLGD